MGEAVKSFGQVSEKSTKASFFINGYLLFFIIINQLFFISFITPDPSEVFKLTTRLESTVTERISTIFVSRNIDMSIKGSTVKQKVFLFYPYS